MSTPQSEVFPEDLADESDDSGPAVVSALSSLGNPPTTPEAQGYARKILDRSLSGETEKGEQSLLQDIEHNAESARQALRQARERLMSQNIDPREQAFARAQAWLSPTKTGLFSENLANYAGTARQQLATQREFDAAKNQQDLALAMQLAGVDNQSLQARLALQKLHEQQQAQLAGHALTVLGRQIRPVGAGTQMSTFGKQAQDEGFAPGTPPYQARVHELVEADLGNKRARAGTDAEYQSPEEKLTVASEAGVPAQVPDPWSGMSTRARLTAQANEQKLAQKKLDAYPAADAAMQNALRMVDEFEVLNSKTHTGPELASMRLGGIHAGLHGAGAEIGAEHGLNINPLSWAPAFDSNIQRMDKISNNLIGLAIPEKGFGRVTNMDMGIFQRGMLSVERDRKTNSDIAKALRIRLQNDLDRHEFEQNYFQVHSHLRGAEQAWNRYLEANPIFDPAHAKDKGESRFTLNPHRLRYDEYFRQQNGAGQQLPEGVTAEDLKDPIFEGMTPEEIATSKRPAKAGGGSVEEFAEGGEVEGDDEDSVDLKRALGALRSGASYKLSTGRESQNAPATNLALEGAGGAATTAALLALASRFPGLRRFIPRGHLGAALVGGGAGAIAGGVSSQNENPTGDILGHAVTGAMLGPLVRGGVRFGTNRLADLADRVRGDPIGAGARRVIDSITSDNPDWNSVATDLRRDARLKVPSTLGEIGPRTQGLATVALGKDTPESAAYADLLQNRQEGANTRVGEQVNQALKPDPYLQKSSDLKNALYANAKPLYDAAYKAFPSVNSPELYELMNTPSGQEAAARAFRMMQDARLPIGQPDATGMIRNPSLQYLDYVKRALDDMITREEGSGPTYQATNQGRLLREMRDKLRAGVDQATTLANGTSPYAEARAQYAGDLEIVDALRSGRDDFPKMTPDELRARFSNMSFAEKDAFRSGVAEGLFNRLGATSDNANPAKKISGIPAIRDKLAVLFDKPAEAQKFLDALDRESTLFEQSRPMLSSAKKGQAEAVTPGSLATAARTRLMKPSTAGEISGTLSATAGPEAQEKIARLRAAADRLKARSDLSDRLGQAAAAGAAVATTPTVENTEQDQVPVQ